MNHLESLNVLQINEVETHYNASKQIMHVKILIALAYSIEANALKC